MDEAAKHLADIVNDDNFTSRHGKSKHQLWQELSDLIAKNPEQISCLNADAVIRSGLNIFTLIRSQLVNERFYEYFFCNISLFYKWPYHND